VDHYFLRPASGHCSPGVYRHEVTKLRYFFDNGLAHYTKAEWLGVLVAAIVTVLLFLIGKFDLFGDQSLTISVTFEVDGFTNLQKLTFYQVGLVHHYVRATAVIEKSRIFITEPLLYDCLQKFTFNLILISLPCYQATPLTTLERHFVYFKKIFV
jgi:hypothetical protein